MASPSALYVSHPTDASEVTTRLPKAWHRHLPFCYAHVWPCRLDDLGVHTETATLKINRGGRGW